MSTEDKKRVQERGAKTYFDAYDKKGAHLVIFRPHQEVAKILAKRSQWIADNFGGVKYGESDIHHTIVSCQLTSNMNAPDNGVMDKLCDATQKAKAELGRKLVLPDCRYGEYLYTPNTVMLSGYETGSQHLFYLTAAAIVQQCRKQGLEVNMPWGMATTFSRFTSDTPAEQLTKFFDHFDKAPLPISFQFASLEVCWHTMDEGRFELHAIEIF